MLATIFSHLYQLFKKDNPRVDPSYKSVSHKWIEQMFLKSPCVLINACFTKDQKRIGPQLHQSFMCLQFCFLLQELMRRFLIPEKTASSSKRHCLNSEPFPDLKSSLTSLKPEVSAQLSQHLSPCLQGEKKNWSREVK